MTATDTIDALLRVIDAGDDGAILPLADLLEEAGDGRAAGLRRVGRRLPRRVKTLTVNWSGRRPVNAEKWQWEPPPLRGAGPLPHHLPRAVFDRLPPLDVPGRKGSPSMLYPTRSAAFLALAAALAG